MSEPPNAAVLVVDDVPENRDLLVRRLKRLGINDVEQAANGIEALAAIERKNFDLVLLDIMMPELDGFGVLERLKQSGRINDLPVVVISALNEIEPVVRYRAGRGGFHLQAVQPDAAARPGPGKPGRESPARPHA